MWSLTFGLHLLWNLLIDDLRFLISLVRSVWKKSANASTVELLLIGHDNFYYQLSCALICRQGTRTLEAKSKNTSLSRVCVFKRCRVYACNDLQRSGECLIDDCLRVIWVCVACKRHGIDRSTDASTGTPATKRVCCFCTNYTFAPNALNSAQLLTIQHKAFISHRAFRLFFQFAARRRSCIISLIMVQN